MTTQIYPIPQEMLCEDTKISPSLFLSGSVLFLEYVNEPYLAFIYLISKTKGLVDLN